MASVERVDSAARAVTVLVSGASDCRLFRVPALGAHATAPNRRMANLRPGIRVAMTKIGVQTRLASGFCSVPGLLRTDRH